jgi:ABC-type branched-subunit amino acid transport system ATPase component
MMPSLELDNVSKRFGGIAAINGVSIQFAEGRITGLVGPNGAGKTTIFNLITGIYPPTGGTVRFDGRDVTGLRPHRIARLGIGRTFQQVRVFNELSVLENALLGLPEISDGIAATLLQSRASRRALEDQARGHLQFVRLETRAEEPASSLSYAEQKLLMLACLLGLGATTLLLDEPTAGLDPTSHGPVLETILHLRETGRTVVLVEHNLDVVRRCCEDAVFLAEGRVVRSGTPAELEADPELGSIYFGKGADSHA